MSGAKEFLEMTTQHEKTHHQQEKIDSVSCSTGKYVNTVAESNLEDVDMSEDDDSSCDYNEDDYVYIEDEETYDNMTIE